MSLLSLIIYLPLQVVFIPFAILGAGLVAYKQLVVSKRLGVPQSAIEILNGRWTMHIFGLREDEASAGLAAALPNTSLFGLWLFLFPLWLKSRISGKQFLYPRVPEPGSETIAELVVARTLFFDKVIERVIGQVDQFVVMGAGYDMRACGYRRDGVSFFEIDQTGMQQHKRASLEKAGIAHEHIRFVDVDFSKESAFMKLIEAGYDPGRKTLFLWEGVTLYLSEADVRKTIEDVQANAPAGSVLLADMYADRFLAFANRSASRKALDYAGEGVDFSLDFATDHEETLSTFVTSESMSVGETFFLGSNNKKGPFAVVVEINLV